MVLDGEMVITDQEGRTDFQALQNYLQTPQKYGQKLSYIVFDLLALDGEDLRGRPLIKRKEILENLLQDAPPNIHYSRHVSGRGKESFLATCEAGLEGIIGKRISSVYSGTRNGDWIKLKCDKREEFVIGGYTVSDKSTGGISSLLLGVYDGEELVYCGRAGTGFSERERKSLAEKLRSLQKEESPFKQAPRPRVNEGIVWVEPELAAEIKYTDWTDDGLLRQASFKGLRLDKNPGEIRRELIDKGLGRPMEKKKGNSIIIGGIKITNPDKVIFDEPEISKADVVRYYERAAERMLPYVSRRILSIVRCPKGISEPCFYKKHPGPQRKEIVTIPVSTGSGEAEDYFYIENKMGLIWEAQMGTLEFHTWGSRVDELEKPDIMVFDLDPDEGIDLSRLRQGVLDIRNILAGLSLKSFLKTSGGKGYHVIVPFQPSVSWDVFYDFAKGVAEVMERKWPDRYTSNMRKNKRAGKIFIDWIRNGRGATAIAPYSLRARKGAKVSMPIAWDELDRVEPDGIDMAEALTRLGAPDPWPDFFSIRQMLKR